MSSNQTSIQDEVFEYDDWIEIYNAGASSVNLQSYYLSDDPNNLQKWEITSSITVPPNGYVIFWADEDQLQGPTHTNFKLSSNGESVFLSNANDVLIDQLSLPALENDFSFGRVTDGSPASQQFLVASPNASNSTGVGALTLPIINPPSGIYSGIETISISADSGTTIYYTTDGTTPSPSSFLYSGPFAIDTSQSIRAIATKPGFGDSEIILHSYIFNPTTQLPILHLTIDPMYLWDDQVGMYVDGTNGTTGPCEPNPKNYNQDWEYQGNATLYETDGTVGFSENCGLSISGGCSRRGAKKSFNVSFKNEFGAKNLDYKLFEDKEVYTYEGFKVRSGGNHRHTYRAMDAMIQKMIEGELDLDHQYSRPVALYLNGQYWGLFNIRDRLNKGYVKANHKKVDSDSLDLIKVPIANQEFRFWIYEDVSQGTNTAYHNLDEYMTTNSLANPTHYDYVSSQIDMNSFLDYFISNIYYNNADWPGNNLKTWKERSINGKWRWMMFDLDFLLSKGAADNTILLNEVLNDPDFDTQRNPIACNPMRQLMENPDFKAEFIQRTNTYIHTLWNANRVNQIFTDYKNEISSEIQPDYDRWQTGWDFQTWDANIGGVKDFFDIRPDSMRHMLDEELNISGRNQLNLNFNSATNGVVALHDNYYLVPENYSGTYHSSIPIQIHAIANPGYRFSHWQETGNTNASLYININTSTTLTPVFVVAQNVVINEIHYNPAGSSEAAEFIEIYNPNSSPMDLSSYEFTDGVCFEFPDNTIINPGEYIIIANDATVYSGQGYQVFQWESSNLNNDGEHLSLDNGAGYIIDSLTYNDGANWASTADNGFYSLALLSSGLDNGIATSWDVQSVYMTPGAQNQFLPYDTYHFPSNLVINEIHYFPFDSITPAGDTLGGKNYEFIEIKNKSSSAVNLTGVALSRGVTFEFPAGSTIAGNGFVVIAEDSIQFLERYGFSPIGKYSGKLSNQGELIWLSNSIGQLMDAVRYDEAFPWDTNANGGIKDYSLALIDATRENDNYLNWKRQCVELQTPNQENDFGCFTGLSYPGLTINEIHYNSNLGNSHEYVEIVNHSAGILNLKDVSIASGVTYHFEGDIYLPGTVAAPLNYIVIADDAVAFENYYGFAPYGEYFGTLSNAGERISIQDFFGDVIDEVTYDDVMPWAILADQGQHSLALISESLDNSLAASWCTQATGSNLTPKAVNVFGDNDSDGVIDCQDICPVLDDNLIGTSCDDGDPCTVGESYDTNCDCSGGVFQDADSDGVCDLNDLCPNADDTIDTNNNGVPDGCEGCSDYITDMSGATITQDTSAQIAIASNGKVQSGNVIEYHAGHEVELMGGFEVESGATFHAYIEPCN